MGVGSEGRRRAWEPAGCGEALPFPALPVAWPKSPFPAWLVVAQTHSGEGMVSGVSLAKKRKHPLLPTLPGPPPDSQSAFGETERGAAYCSRVPLSLS